MMQLKRIVVLALVTTVLHWAAAADARAQTSTSGMRLFASVDGGFQSGSQRLSDRSTFNRFAEEGSTDVNYDIDRAGVLFHAKGGVLFWQGIGFAVGFSRMTATGVADVAVSSPHPLFFDRPRLSTTSLTALGHRENMVHFQGVWVLPVSNRVDVTVSGGASRISLDQAIVTDSCEDGGCLGPEVAPFNSVDITNLRVEELNESGLGFNVGVDLSYMFARYYGVGVFAQYAGGSIDLPFAGGVASVDVGGFQVGGGLRFCFGVNE